MATCAAKKQAKKLKKIEIRAGHLDGDGLAAGRAYVAVAVRGVQRKAPRLPDDVRAARQGTPQESAPSDQNTCCEMLSCRPEFWERQLATFFLGTVANKLFITFYRCPRENEPS